MPGRRGSVVQVFSVLKKVMLTCGQEEPGFVPPTLRFVSQPKGKLKL